MAKPLVTLCLSILMVQYSMDPDCTRRNWTSIPYNREDIHLHFRLGICNPTRKVWKLSQETAGATQSPCRYLQSMNDIPNDRNV